MLYTYIIYIHTYIPVHKFWHHSTTSILSPFNNHFPCPLICFLTTSREIPN